jgi:hypothetical protein
MNNKLGLECSSWLKFSTAKLQYHTYESMILSHGTSMLILLAHSYRQKKKKQTKKLNHDGTKCPGSRVTKVLLSELR